MQRPERINRLDLFPPFTSVNKTDHLAIGGCDTVELAAQFGTPLYIFDEAGIRQRCAELKREFGKRYTLTAVIYAAKAFLNRALAVILKEEGVGLDVVSAGELSIARSVDFPMGQVYFHGNNKSQEELDLALKWGVGYFVVDNFYELELLNELAKHSGCRPNILIRLSPGVDPHTHEYLSTGIIDSKFGFPLLYGEEVIARAMAMPNLNLIGLHCHIGSLIFDTSPYRDAIEHMIDFAAGMTKKYGLELKKLNVGGGFAVQYVVDTASPSIAAYADVITTTVISKCREADLPLPEMVFEPGRSLIAQNGVALYTVGAIKDIPGIRRYVCVDGGISDNIRPALYGAKYEAIVANHVDAKMDQLVTIAGKFCESGDILIKDIMMPPIAAGDLIAIPDCGAYCIPMSSNYNAFLRPAIIMVKNGKARLIRRRDTFGDLIGHDFIGVN